MRVIGDRKAWDQSFTRVSVDFRGKLHDCYFAKVKIGLIVVYIFRGACLTGMTEIRLATFESNDRLQSAEPKSSSLPVSRQIRPLMRVDVKHDFG